jgi:molybdopterin-binding protein
MSKIKATVSEIQNCNALHIVKLKFHQEILTMVSLELTENIKVGIDVILSIKPTHVALAKNLQGNLSYSNQLKCIVKNINQGKLLASIDLQYQDNIIESIITKESLNRIKIVDGDEVTALIKSSELSISEVI